MASSNTYETTKPIYKESYSDSKKKRFQRIKKCCCDKKKKK